MNNILEQIINKKKQEVADSKRQIPFRQLESASLFSRKTLSMTNSIRNAPFAGIIAEFKRKSPSRGFINKEAEIVSVSKGYTDAGACGLSVLTDEYYFGGCKEDLLSARKYNALPVLRKDFIVDEYQVIEAKSIGADVILLIAAALSHNRILQLAQLAHSLELQVLLEVHQREELDSLNSFIDMLGVNNRDLKTFQTDIRHSIELAPYLPKAIVKLSESGIHNAIQIRELKEVGYDGFLIGDLFMCNADPAAQLAYLINELE